MWPNPANAHVPRLSGLCVLLARIGGAALPKLARYQLRYTRILNFEVFLSVVIPVVNANFRNGPASRTNPANARTARLSGLCMFLSRIGGAVLPNHPRYQLRYTRPLKPSLLRREEGSRTGRPQPPRPSSGVYPICGQALNQVIIPDPFALCKGLYHDSPLKQHIYTARIEVSRSAIWRDTSGLFMVYRWMPSTPLAIRSEIWSMA